MHLIWPKPKVRQLKVRFPEISDEVQLTLEVEIEALVQLKCPVVVLPIFREKVQQPLGSELVALVFILIV